MMSRFAASFLLVLLFVPLAFASDAGLGSPMSDGNSARSLAMGGGTTALVADASSIFFNPSGLAFMDYQQASFMHASYFEGTTYSYGAWAFPMSARSGIGISFQRLGTSDIIRRSDYLDMGTFDYSTSQFTLSAAKRIIDRIAVGASFKFVNQSMDRESVYGFGGDIGIRIMLSNHFTLGFIARDIMPAELEIGNSAEKYAKSYVGGAALNDLKISEAVYGTLSLDVEKVRGRKVHVRGGCELSIDEKISLRGGYDRDAFTVGAGFSPGRIKIDYAYKLMEYVRNTHFISLTFNIGESITAREARQTASVPISIPLSDREKEILRLKEVANHHFHHFQLDSALVYFRKLLAIDPNDEEAEITITAIHDAQRVQTEQQDLISKAEDERRGYLQSFYARSELFFAQKNYAAALDYVQLVLDAEPYNVAAFDLKKEISESIQSDIDSCMLIAVSLQRQGKLVRAVETYSHVLELDSTNVPARDERERVMNNLDLSGQVSLGVAFFGRGRYERARLVLQRVLAVRPDEAVALEYLSKIDEALSRESTDAPSLEDIQANSVVWRYYTDGLRFMRDLQYEKAIESWTKVLKVFPENRNTLDNIEQARLRLQSDPQ